VRRVDVLDEVDGLCDEHVDAINENFFRFVELIHVDLGVGVEILNPDFNTGKRIGVVAQSGGAIPPTHIIGAQSIEEFAKIFGTVR
jgi:hypothetical protein